METFEWVPLANPQGRYRHQTFRARFGEGYTQAAGAGINSRYDEWPLTFQGSRTMIEDIQNFLDRHQGFRPFRWFPPLGTGAGLYDADEYTVSPGAGGCANYTLNLTFRLRMRMYAPTYSVPPVVSGLHQIGQVISVSQGTWQSENPMQFEYQWLRNGQPIAGATGQNYTLVDDDLFNMISVRVTASSLGGSTSVETDPVLARLDSAVSWLYSDIAETIFVDTSGNTPATWGDPVGLIKDSSGNGNDFTQPTVTARPILGRVPRGGRRNLLRNTEEFASWSVAGTGTAKTDVFELEGVQYQRFSTSGDTAFSSFSCLVPNVSATVAVVPGRYIKSFRYIPGDAPAFWDRTPNTAGNSLQAKFDIAGGAVSFSGFSGSWAGISGVTATASAVGDGSWDINIVYSVTEVMSVTAGTISLLNGTAAAYEDAGSFGNLQFEMVAPEVSVHSHYQRVGSTIYDITESGVPDVHYLDFDGTDDLVSTELPAISNGTLVIAGTNGIWIDDDFNFDGGTFSIGPTSYTNGPEGILTAIGEPIVGGFLVINRQLSQRERAMVIEEMKERGAPGVFRWSENLWGDNTQFAGTGWTDNGGGSYTGVSAPQGSGPVQNISQLGDGDYLHLEATVDREAGTIRFIAYGETTFRIFDSVSSSGTTEINAYGRITNEGGSRTQSLFAQAWTEAFTGTVSTSPSANWS